MIEHLIASGVHGVFPMGTTGEFYAVSDEEYRRILEVTVETVSGRVDVYTGAGSIVSCSNVAPGWYPTSTTSTSRATGRGRRRPRGS